MDAATLRSLRRTAVRLYRSAAAAPRRFLSSAIVLLLACTGLIVPALHHTHHAAAVAAAPKTHLSARPLDPLLGLQHGDTGMEEEDGKYTGPDPNQVVRSTRLPPGPPSWVWS